MTVNDCTCVCQVCGTPYAPTRNKDGSRRKTKYAVCSRVCANAVYYAAYYASKKIAPSSYDRDCAWCSASFVGTQATALYCGSGCKMKAKQSRRKTPSVRLESRRARDAKRRALKRTTSVERIEPERVFERDRWRCHLCGIRTLKSLRGTLNDRAPELEHIVALADGGTHTWGNVACSCKKCNRKKGAASLGQRGLGVSA